MNSEGDFLVDIGEGDHVDVNCGLIDAFGVDGVDVRTWKVGKLFSISGESGEKSDTASVTITPTSLASSIDLSLRTTQNEIMGPKEDTTITKESEVTLQLTGLKPGSFKINATVSGANIITKEMSFSLGMSKQSQPPSISIDNNLNGEQATWDNSGYSFVIAGTALDSDGESIQLEATLCGATTTDFKRTGSSFEVTISIAACGGKDMETYDVTITASDESSSKTEVEVKVKEPGAETTPETVDDDDIESSDDTPFIGAIGTLVALLGAAMLARRD